MATPGDAVLPSLRGVQVAPGADIGTPGEAKVGSYLLTSGDTAADWAGRLMGTPGEAKVGA